MPYQHPKIRKRVLYEPGRHKDWRGWTPNIFESLIPYEEEIDADTPTSDLIARATMVERPEPYPEVELMEDWPTFVRVYTAAGETTIDFEPWLFFQLPLQIRHAIILITAELVLDCLTDDYLLFMGTNLTPPVAAHISLISDTVAFEMQGEFLQRTRDMIDRLFIAIEEPELDFEEIRVAVEPASRYYEDPMEWGGGNPIIAAFFSRLFAFYSAPEPMEHITHRGGEFLTIAFMILMTCNGVPFSQFYWSTLSSISWHDWRDIDSKSTESMSRALIQGWWKVILKRLAFRGWELPTPRKR